jgi:hypothetical protein
MKNTAYLCVALFLLVLSACEPDDNEKEWGVAKVYMPQAAILNGGLSNDYPVPLSNNASTENYEIDPVTNTLKITLGVYRSGLSSLKAYSVSVQADIDASNAAVGSINKGILLPADTYSLPSTVSVPDGEREAVFSLNVDLNKLISDYPSYGGGKLVLVVGISDPTKYELNPKLSKTTIIIDGPSFLPAPKIVQGGDFESGSEQYWTRVNFSGSLDESVAAITNGALVFNYGTTAATGEIYFYNTIQLEKEKTYKFSSNFSSTGGSTIVSARFYLIVTHVLSSTVSYAQDGQYSSDTNTFFCMWDAWNGMKNPVNGTLPQNSGWAGGNIEKGSGLFTPKFSGTGYLIIGVVAWGSPIGIITLDNIKIEEQ